MKNCGTPRWPVRSTISSAAGSSSVTSTSSYSIPLAPRSALALAQYGHHSIEYICTRAIVTSAVALTINLPTAIPVPNTPGTTSRRTAITRLDRGNASGVHGAHASPGLERGSKAGEMGSSRHSGRRHAQGRRRSPSPQCRPARHEQPDIRAGDCTQASIASVRPVMIASPSERLSGARIPRLPAPVETGVGAAVHDRLRRPLPSGPAGRTARQEPWHVRGDPARP